jgi:hypothetical protein
LSETLQGAGLSPSSVLLRNLLWRRSRHHVPVMRMTRG